MQAASFFGGSHLPDCENRHRHGCKESTRDRREGRARHYVHGAYLDINRSPGRKQANNGPTLSCFQSQPKENHGKNFNHRRSRQLILPFGEAHYAPIAPEDLGRVVASILADPLGHAGQIYPLFGPKELTQFEVTEILSDVLGRKITFVPMKIEAFKGWATAGK